MSNNKPIISSKPSRAAPAEKVRDSYYCCRCTRTFKKQKGYFPASQSSLYKGNGGYLPACNHCVDELFEHYKYVLGSEAEAAKRVCSKFDLYWHPDLYSMVYKLVTTQSFIKTYISKSYLSRFHGKTYDDTIDDERAAIEAKPFVVKINPDNQQCEEVDIDVELIDFWGVGLEPGLYIELDKKYKWWTKDLSQKPDRGAEAIYKQICILEATINIEQAAGKPIESKINALNSLLGSAKIKPSQQKAEEPDTEFDNLPFGVGIRMYENSHPIPEPDPEFQDVDGIVKYISVWFLGHLCKMLGIKNSYCKMYERELERLKVENPEFEEEDDEEFFDDIFGGDTDE